MAWPKHLTVDKRIISLLSASTYESFPRALRELVSNSYDADATQVDITLSVKDKVLTVKDNGTGMTPDEFDFFLRIAGRQRTRKRTTVLGRKRIGQFGIGFLAMFPFCETVEVESTVAGSPVVFRARIPAARFSSESAKVEDLTAADVPGRELEDDKLLSEHYTTFKLVDTTHLLHRYLAQHFDQKKFKNSIRSYSGIERLKWELQDILPIPLPETSVVSSFVNPEPADFTVTLNSQKLIANDYVEEVLAHSDSVERVGNIGFRYAIGTPWKAVKPDEARGMRVRLNQVGVGTRQYFDLGVLGRTFSRLHWLTGEVSIIEGLDEAITLDRDSFTAGEDYDSFREFFRTKLRDMAFFVEDVDVAKRKIAAQTSHSPRAETASTAQVIEDQVDRLKKRGFSVETRSGSFGSEKRPTIEINTKQRTVTIAAPEHTIADRIAVAGKTWRVKYAEWDYEKDHYKGCRIVGERTIEINQDYPLFRGANKDIFRRLQILLAQAENESGSKKELFEKIQSLLLEEFDNR
ncbi:MAG: ATP-binding protein [Acidobacteria bacterium]|nr:ATP-binding protein [Acidobacteriota bacterium]